jgi:hypothetical protein
VLRWERRIDEHARFGKTVVRPLRHARANGIVAPGSHFGGSGIDGACLDLQYFIIEAKYAGNFGGKPMYCCHR